MRTARRRLSAAVAAGLLGSLVPVATPLASTTSAAAVAGEYVVTFDPDVDAVAKARKERALGNEVSDVFSEAVEGFVATLDANDVVLSYAVQWDAAHPLHLGRDGSFTYFPSLFGGFLNPPPAE